MLFRAQAASSKLTNEMGGGVWWGLITLTMAGQTGRTMMGGPREMDFDRERGGEEGQKQKAETGSDRYRRRRPGAGRV